MEQIKQLRKIETEVNREFLEEYADSTKPFILIGKISDVKQADGKVLCFDIAIKDLEINIDRGYTRYWKLGPNINHAFIPSELIQETQTDEFLAYAQVNRYQRKDGTYSYGFSKAPKLRELELELKLAITFSLKTCNASKRRFNYIEILRIIDEIGYETNKEDNSLERLSIFKIDTGLLELAEATLNMLYKSLKPSKKKKKNKLRRTKSKGFSKE